jgi:hypothetical protein
MNEGLKFIAATENDPAKATAYLEMIPAFARIDEQRIAELSQSAIKIINGLPEPGFDDKPGSSARKEHARNLMSLAYQVIPVFRLLARRDEQGALDIAENLRLREIKTTAIFAAITAAPPPTVITTGATASSN